MYISALYQFKNGGPISLGGTKSLAKWGLTGAGAALIGLPAPNC